MEPNYDDLDPDEKLNRIWSMVSVALGLFSLCAGLIPVAGIILGALGLAAGIAGRRSDQVRMATIGLSISVMGIIISLVYAVFIAISKLQ